MRITGYLMIRLNDCDEGKDFCPDREILDVRRKLRDIIGSALSKVDPLPT